MFSEHSSWKNIAYLRKPGRWLLGSSVSCILTKQGQSLQKRGMCSMSRCDRWNWMDPNRQMSSKHLPTCRDSFKVTPWRTRLFRRFSARKQHNECRHVQVLAGGSEYMWPSIPPRSISYTRLLQWAVCATSWNGTSICKLLLRPLQCKINTETLFVQTVRHPVWWLLQQLDIFPFKPCDVDHVQRKWETVWKGIHSLPNNGWQQRHLAGK